MLTIIKNIFCYAPEPLGLRDIFIAGEKIYKISPPGLIDCPHATLIDGEGCSAFPGIIDGHVHIIGGGGEEGPQSRIGEIDAKEILMAGVTTLVGLLGADDQTKSLFALLAKARALEAEGITTYIYSGSYAMPPVTLTGDITRDMILIDKVVGAGEIAISDHRSSHPTFDALMTIGSKIHMGGLLSGKAGLFHFHLGDGKEGLNPVKKLLNESNLPPALLLPTHLNRSPRLLREGIAYAGAGGNIDLTSGETEGVSLPDAVKQLLCENIDTERVTASSDANGSIPCGGVGRIQTLFEDIVRCVTEKNIPPSIAFSLVSTNTALRLGLYPKKGALKEGSDADILILDRDYSLKMLFSNGSFLIGEMSIGKADSGNGENGKTANQKSISEEYKQL